MCAVCFQGELSLDWQNNVVTCNEISSTVGSVLSCTNKPVLQLELPLSQDSIAYPVKWRHFVLPDLQRDRQLATVTKCKETLGVIYLCKGSTFLLGYIPVQSLITQLVI